MAKNAQTTGKYLDLISVNKSDLEKEELSFRNDDARLHVEASILETKKELSTARRQLTESQRAVPYNLSNEIDAAEKVKQLEEGLAYAEKVLAERF